LENIIATGIYQCKNKEDGCEETFRVNDIKKHQSECLYQSRDCPFRKLSGVNCLSTATLALMKGQMNIEHVPDTTDTV
jgi:hypothetical protein